MSALEHVIVCSLGRVAYGPTWDLQQRIQRQLIDAKRREVPRILPHVVLLLEHPPVFTLGKSGDANHLLVEERALETRGVEFHRIDRGGDITFHGPGQLVGYFLLDLDRFKRDLHVYLRALEEIVIRTCGDYGLHARRVRGRTGVWTGSEGTERKICAFGIRSSRWVTMHGMAFNLDTDLSYFGHIVPCGIQDRGVTSLAEELGAPCDERAIRRTLTGHFEDVFVAKVTELEDAAAYRYLSTLTQQANLRHTLEVSPRL